jgi:hypothetical protein
LPAVFCPEGVSLLRTPSTAYLNSGLGGLWRSLPAVPQKKECSLLRLFQTLKKESFIVIFIGKQEIYRTEQFILHSFANITLKDHNFYS